MPIKTKKRLLVRDIYRKGMQRRTISLLTGLKMSTIYKLTKDIKR